MDPVSQTSQVKVDGLEVKAPASADIFVACASDAGEWAERFIDMLTRPGARVDSAAEGTRSSVRQKPGSQRYAAFVALVTPEYVANNEAGIDTSAFIGPGGGGTRRFAVHLRSAPWQELPWMARFTLLPADGSAVLDADDPDRVLAEIAESVRAQVDASAAESPRDAIPSTAGESPLDALLARYPMEEAVREIFVMAYSIASSHQPPRPLGSSLLMSSAALTRNVLDPAQQWLSDQLGTERMEGLVREALSASGRMPAEVFSVGASAIVDGAAVIAREASGTPSICVRHLVGSLITTQTGALAYVQARGLTAEELRERYFAFVQNQGDDDAAWARTLGLPLSEPRLLAHFDADDSRSEDFLDVRPDVLAFAGLIAARTLTPPLSIGLFGEWGSGKTFFMRMLRREVDRLAQQADASSAMQRDLPFWKRIIQIEFNAWHYTEGNLWASLVQHIFENL
ncbi:MAG TPA: P-loop NTPase fold protein, partial [Longimicrobium sp.]|nr:P-loop NTPase fold protein [Longimicrobium sp.]